MKYLIKIEQEVEHDGVKDGDKWTSEETIEGTVYNAEDVDVLTNLIISAFDNVKITITATNKNKKENA